MTTMKAYDNFVFDDFLVSPVNGIKYKKINYINRKKFHFI